jgi:hypothetical protein
VEATLSSDSALIRYYDKIKIAGQACDFDSGLPTSEPGFRPAYKLPDMDRRLVEFFDLAKIELYRIGKYLGRDVNLLNLSGNSRTKTTKTFASLVMVARAVAHIQTTGESVLIVTPTSGNKGGALRDAVLRALECKLVEPHQLRIAIVVPKAGVSKLWSSPLSEDRELRRLNPIFIADAEDGSVVKRITREFVRQNCDALKEKFGLNVWHTYELNNYRMADAVRAFFELDHMGPAQPGRARVQAQSVSSAFGLLGHNFGLKVLSSMGEDVGGNRQWLLVQHLGTPDLVLDMHYRSFSRENMPIYDLDPESGLFVQDAQPFFPLKTYKVDEVIDSTFYSRNPATRDLIRGVLSEQGGAGIVVSLYECIERYPQLRQMLANTGLSLPADLRDLREWSMTMVLTGVLNAIDRGIVPRESEVLVHITGSYSVQDFVPLPQEQTVPVAGPDDIKNDVIRAMHAATSKSALQPAQ